MNLYQLKQFMFVAEEGSVTRGAERAAISQPAVSRAIADLESVVGERLFDRGPKGVALTEAGRVLLGYAERIFILEREAGEALTDLHGLKTGTLSIGASTTVGDYLLPSAISEFLIAHPSIDLSMDVSNTEAIQAGVLEGRYDVGFTEGDVDLDLFEVRVLGQDQLLVISSPVHPLSSGFLVRPEELARHGFVMREPGSGTRRIVESAMRGAGFEPIIACSLGSTTAVKRAVAQGVGLGVVSALALSEEIKRGELVEVPTTLTLSRSLHTVRLGWRRESAALRGFMEVLKTQMRDSSHFALHAPIQR